MDTYFQAVDLRTYARRNPGPPLSMLQAAAHTRIAQSGGRFDIFLSHSNVDREAIEGLYKYLAAKGYGVYAYWIEDPHLDELPVTPISVNLIRKRMRQCTGLVYAMSMGATASRWMPWELGYADGQRNPCVLLPIMEVESNSLQGHDFLSVYPTVIKEPFTKGPYELQVSEGGVKRPFRDWLRPAYPL